MRNQWSIGIIFFVLIGVSRSVPGQTINEAVSKYDASIYEAAEKLTAHYRKLIAEAAAEGNSRRVAALNTYIKQIHDEGALRLVDGTKASIHEYMAVRNNAADELRSAYARLIKQANDANNFDTASALAEELTERRLPNGTVSFKAGSSNKYLSNSPKGVVSRFPSDDVGRLWVTWEEVPGLSDPKHSSFRPSTWPTKYLDHFGFRLRVVPYKDHEDWKKHATWIKVKALSNSRTGYSFRSVSHPDRYIRVRDNGEIWLDEIENTVKFKRQATFFHRKGMFGPRD